MNLVTLLTCFPLVVTSLKCFKYHHVASPSDVGHKLTSFYGRVEECAAGVTYCLKWEGRFRLSDFYFEFTRPYFNGGCGPTDSAITTTESAGNSVTVACPTDFSSSSQISTVLQSSITARAPESFLSFPLSSVASSLGPYPFYASDSWLVGCGSRGVSACVESESSLFPPLACGREGFDPVVYAVHACSADLCNSTFTNTALIAVFCMLLLTLVN